MQKKWVIENFLRLEQNLTAVPKHFKVIEVKNVPVNY